MIDWEINNRRGTVNLTAYRRKVCRKLLDANRYLIKHTERLEAFGFTGIRAKTFVINEALSQITKAV